MAFPLIPIAIAIGAILLNAGTSSKKDEKDEKYAQYKKNRDELHKYQERYRRDKELDNPKNKLARVAPFFDLFM